MEVLSVLPPFLFKSNDILPWNLFMNPVICAVFPSWCHFALQVSTGGHETQMNISRMGVYATYLPAGSSFTNFRHYTQTMQSDRFAKYDYGKEKNLQIYGRIESPEYDLKKISGKVAIFYCEGENDINAGSRHNRWLIENMPKTSLVYSEALKNFEHSDFGTGINARSVLYDKMIELMKIHED